MNPDQEEHLEDGTLKLRVGVIACFSEDDFDLNLELDRDSAELHAGVLANDARHLNGKHHELITREEAESFVRTILAIVGREQVLYGDRATMYWSLELKWDFGEHRGEIAATNRDGDRRLLEDLVRSASLDPKVKQKVQETLDTGLHQWPQEVYYVTQEFLLAVFPAKGNQ